MANFVMSATQRLAFDAVNGTAEHSKEEMNTAIRAAVLDACGGEWNYYNFQANKYRVFAIIAELMPAAMNASLAAKFDPFAEFKDVAMGDKPYFDVHDRTVYPVYTVARRVGNVDRQRIVDSNFTVATEMKMVKIYDEFDRFMAGKIDMGRIVEVATKAFENHVGLLIATAIYDSYASVGTNYKNSGSFSASSFATIMEHVKAANGVDNLQIWGTLTALANVTDASAFGYSDAAKDKANGVGYWGEFRGASLFSLPQAYLPQSQTFGVSDNQLIVVPAGDSKLVKVVFEGDTLVDSKDGLARADLQPEFLFGRRVGVAALTVPEGKYGFWKFA